MSDAAFQNQPNPSLAGKNVLVMGLGQFGGGVGVSRWLVEQGAHVTVTDTASNEVLSNSVKALDGLPIVFKLGTPHAVEDFLAADLLVLNPAVDKEKSAIVKTALAQGIAYTTEMNLFVQRCRGHTIGITGSVGKSTTTMLIYEALVAGSNGTDTQVFLGGNIGRSLLLDLPKIRPSDLVLLELSSFMLEETPRIAWSPHIAVITNVFANHLDRHNTMEAYAAAKQNILHFQTPNDVAILNDDHDAVRQWASLARGRIRRYTTHGVPALPLVLPGQHNQSNARAALAVLDALLEYAAPLAPRRNAALAAIENFAGLAHRLALVHTLTLEGNRAVRFYNDSKATSPDASITALRAFEPRTALFLVGGYDKHIDLSPFETELTARAAGVIGIGQTGEAIIANVGPGVRTAYAGTLEAALPLAREWARVMPAVSAVVLSPASASWGQFANYEKRGERFAELSRLP